MRGLLRWVTFVLAFAWLSLGVGDAAAQKLYKWTDKDGKVHFSNVEDAPWGAVTSFALPSGATVGLYQPRHPTAFKR